ncbi:MAG: hypothetical protein ABI639_16555 [Thermoanaerobaculia bacterium]
MNDRKAADSQFERLNRLTVEKPCEASWESMEGGYRERFCTRCEKRVYDFRHLTEKEIERRIEAHRGSICARLTRNAEGDILFVGSHLPGTPQENASAPLPARLRRPQPAAAMLLTAILGATSASARSPGDDKVSSEAPRDPGTSRSGGDRIAVDEAMVVSAPEPEDFEVISGAVAVMAPPLHQAFEDSSLVLLATAGKTTAVEEIDPEEGYVEVETELEVEDVIKGGVTRGPVFLRYSAFAVPESDSAAVDEADSGRLRRGSLVLAFLEPSADSTGRNVYRALRHRPPMEVSEAQATAYRERLDELATALSPHSTGADGESAGESSMSTAEILDWLIKTAEEPLTRSEAVFALDGRDVTIAQRLRLRDALLRTRQIDWSDLALFRLVRAWAPKDSMEWLRVTAAEVARSAVRHDVAEPDLGSFWGAAESLGDRELMAHLSNGMGAIEALREKSLSDPGALTLDGELASSAVVRLSRELLQQFAERLEAEREPSEAAVR